MLVSGAAVREGVAQTLPPWWFAMAMVGAVGSCTGRLPEEGREVEAIRTLPNWLRVVQSRRERLGAKVAALGSPC